MNSLVKLILNSISLIAAIFFNYWVNSGKATGSTIGEISNKYDSLVTPAPYAFSIWGIIYLLLISFVAYQWYEWIKFRKTANLDKCGYWFLLSNIANGLWSYVWLLEYPLLSVLVMLTLLFSLIQLTINLRLEIWDAPLNIIAFVWWPICLYLGWIVLATVANISSALVSTGWEGQPLTETAWAIILITIATIIYLLLIKKRNLREAALVGVWGFIGIVYKQMDSNSSVMIAASIGAIILFIAASIHAYKNYKTSPIQKWKEK